MSKTMSATTIDRSGDVSPRRLRAGVAPPRGAGEGAAPTIFADRADAGRRLARALASVAGERPIVFALPRGGAPVAAEIARALGAPLDLMIARKIGAPGNPELAMGALAEGDPPVVIRNEDVIRHFCVSPEAFATAETRAIQEIARRGALWRGGAPALSPQGRVAILVDDGVATGATAAAALRALRARGARQVILAAPVAPPEALAAMAQAADRVVCLETPADFWAVGAHYEDFAQLDDEEVTEILAAARAASVT